jgi:hypothetical protein
LNRVLVRVGISPIRTAPADLSNYDLWDAWAVAATDARLALQAWCSAERAERADAYAVYMATLDREEQAARVLTARVAPRPSPAPAPAG